MGWRTRASLKKQSANNQRTNNKQQTTNSKQQKNKEQSLGTVSGRFWDGFGTVSGRFRDGFEVGKYRDGSRDAFGTQGRIFARGKPAI
jgi:hypothetical protein